MNATHAYQHSFEHPSLNLLVTDAQRDRAVSYLQEAYADGRLTEPDFDMRVGQALKARTRRELNAAFAGLVQVTPTQQVFAAHPAYLPVVSQNSDSGSGRAAAGLAHLSTIPMPLLGPGIFYAVTAKGSYARSQAAKAFNFQLFALVIAAGLGLLSNLVGVFDALGGIWMFAWFVLTIVGAVKAFSGEPWRNPIMKKVPFAVLDERMPRALGR
ncbi:DUF1707 and DUF4870 domain-containing protein [Propionibacteriaceae bacterium G1746]|uniref:DUF1707 and DUF4870 domain-containing protein n=1 Tax=Aestuariimicrobium sp. G57 TaxID=3418485 RepID=UPI003C25B5D9